MSLYGTILLTLLLQDWLGQGRSHQAPARPWALTLDAVRPIAVPAGVRNRVLAELEYEPSDSVRGTVVDLNHDGTPDYIVRSAASLCGTGGCLYLVIDGATEKILGQVFGEPLYIQVAESHGYPVITSYAHMSAVSGSYTTWVFDGQAYQKTSSRSVEGASLDSLFAILRRVPVWRPRQ